MRAFGLSVICFGEILKAKVDARVRLHEFLAKMYRRSSRRFNEPIGGVGFARFAIMRPNLEIEIKRIGDI